MRSSLPGSPDGVRRLSQQLRSTGGEFAEAGGEARHLTQIASSMGWEGAAQERFASATTRLRAPLQVLDVEVRQGAQILAQFGDALDDLQRRHGRTLAELEDAQSLVGRLKRAVSSATTAVADAASRVARATHAVQDELLQVASGLPVIGGGADTLLREEQRFHDQAQRTLTSTVRQLTDTEHSVAGLRRRLVDIEDEWEAVVRHTVRALLSLDVVDPADAAVRRLLGFVYGTADPLRQQLRGFLDGDPSPEEIAIWWASLSQKERKHLIETEADLLGNLNGIPPTDRYAANQVRINAEITRAKAEIEALRKKVEDGNMFDDFGNWVGDKNPLTESDTERLRWLEKRLETLEGFHGRKIWLFDPSGDGRAAEVFGDLERAQNVAVVVPGITNDLSNFGSIRGNAENLQAMMSTVGGPSATIAWLGYDTPDDAVAGTTIGPADVGARALRDTVGEIRRVNSGAFTNVSGHSYGSVVAGHAMQDGLDVDAVSVVGSPGMGANSRAGLGSIHVPVYAGRNWNDVVPYTEAHGTTPTSLAGVHDFPTGTSGHSEYYREGSASLRNLALIATGQQPW
ncbi:MAG TPA: alpha/beta hydrolase [Aquihabitans sp.]|nr:alpha/beta hydrolase [Aquihabitans sp.]